MMVSTMLVNRSVGTHEVRVHLFPEVDPVISVEVVGSES